MEAFQEKAKELGLNLAQFLDLAGDSLLDPKIRESFPERKKQGRQKKS